VNIIPALTKSLDLGENLISQIALTNRIITFAKLAAKSRRGTRFFSSKLKAMLWLEESKRKKPKEFMRPWMVNCSLA